jgi:FHA domain
MPTTCPAGHDTASTDFCDVCGMRVGGPTPAPAQASAPARGSPGGQGEYCPRCGADRRGQFCEACGYTLASRPVAPAATAAPGPAPPVPAPAAVAPGSVSAAPGPATPGPISAAPDPAAPAPTPVAPRPVSSAPGPAASGPASAAPGPAVPGSGRVGTAPSYVATVPSQVTKGTGDGAAAEWTAVATADRAYFDSVIAVTGPDAAAVQFPDYCPERRFRLFGPEMRIGRRSPSRGLEPEIDLTGPPTDPGVSHLHAVLIADEDGGWTVLDPGSANGTLVNGSEMAPGSRVRLRDGDRISLGAWTVLTIRAT